MPMPNLDTLGLICNQDRQLLRLSSSPGYPLSSLAPNRLPGTATQGKAASQDSDHQLFSEACNEDCPLTIVTNDPATHLLEFTFGKSARDVRSYTRQGYYNQPSQIRRVVLLSMRYKQTSQQPFSQHSHNQYCAAKRLG